MRPCCQSIKKACDLSRRPGRSRATWSWSGSRATWSRSGSGASRPRSTGPRAAWPGSGSAWPWSWPGSWSAGPRSRSGPWSTGPWSWSRSGSGAGSWSAGSRSRSGAGAMSRISVGIACQEASGHGCAGCEKPNEQLASGNHRCPSCRVTELWVCLFSLGGVSGTAFLPTRTWLSGPAARFGVGLAVRSDSRLWLGLGTGLMLLRTRRRSCRSRLVLGRFWRMSLGARDRPCVIPWSGMGHTTRQHRSGSHKRSCEKTSQKRSAFQHDILLVPKAPSHTNSLCRGAGFVIPYEYSSLWPPKKSNTNHPKKPAAFLLQPAIARIFFAACHMPRFCSQSVRKKATHCFQAGKIRWIL